MQQPLYLQIQAEGDKYTFNYSTDGHSFKNLGGIVSGDILSTNVAGGFTGNMIGLYATSANMLILNKQVSNYQQNPGSSLIENEPGF